MSKKTQLIKVFKDYKEKYEAVQAKKIEIDKSELYTPEGREEVIRKLLGNFEPIVQQDHDEAVKIINQGLEALAMVWKNSSAGKLTDSGYQAGLSNVIKALELGAIREKDDIQNIIDTYSGDFNALAMIKKILKNSNDETLVLYASMVPEDNRDKNKHLLNQLKRNVDTYMNVNALKSASKSWNSFNQGLTGVSTSMDSMAEFVETKLGDDLELL